MLGSSESSTDNEAVTLSLSSSQLYYVHVFSADSIEVNYDLEIARTGGGGSKKGGKGGGKGNGHGAVIDEGHGTNAAGYAFGDNDGHQVQYHQNIFADRVFRLDGQMDFAASRGQRRFTSPLFVGDTGEIYEASQADYSWTRARKVDSAMTVIGRDSDSATDRGFESDNIGEESLLEDLLASQL